MEPSIVSASQASSGDTQNTVHNVVDLIRRERNTILVTYHIEEKVVHLVAHGVLYILTVLPVYHAMLLDDGNHLLSSCNGARSDTAALRPDDVAEGLLQDMEHGHGAIVALDLVGHIVMLGSNHLLCEIRDPFQILIITDSLGA